MKNIDEIKSYVMHLPDNKMNIIHACQLDYKYQHKIYPMYAKEYCEFLATVEEIEQFMKKDNFIGRYKIIRYSRYVTDEGYLVPVEVVKHN